ncbi:MAG: cyclase family protein [Methanomassiliicoccales archaeon]
MKLIDISVSVNEAIPIYKGNPAYEAQWAMRISHGDQVNLTCISEGVHTGTHIDAPYHFIEGGKKIDELPLSSFIANVSVLRCRSKSIGLADVKRLRIRKGEGVLFRTKNSECYNEPFREDFVYLEGEAAAWLAAKGVSIVGIDYLSIDKYNSPDAPSHHALLSRNIPIVEGLNLRRVAEGKYTFVCFPVRLEGREAAPARAILISPPLPEVRRR